MSQREEFLEMRVRRLEQIVACHEKRLDICCGDSTCIPPQITNQPDSQTINQGEQLVLVVNNSGDTPFTYQWFRNGSPITGATSSTYAVPSAAPANGGNYTVQIVNACGTTTSAVATVTIIPMIQLYYDWVVREGNPDYEAIYTAFLANPATMEHSIYASGGSDYSIDFSGNTVPAILLVAEPIGQPVKTEWYVTDFNKGNISGTLANPDGDTFVQHNHTNDPQVNSLWRLYISDFQTQQPDPIQFKK